MDTMDNWSYINYDDLIKSIINGSHSIQQQFSINNIDNTNSKNISFLNYLLSYDNINKENILEIIYNLYNTLHNNIINLNQNNCIKNMVKRIKDEWFLDENINIIPNNIINLNYLKNNTKSIKEYKEASELGINCEVEFFDTKNDISHLNKIIKKVKPNKFDAIIGPLIPKNFNYLSSLGYFRDTPLIAPLSTKPVKFVKNVYQSVTSKEFLRKKMYKYLDKIIDSTKNTLIIADTLNREIEKELNLRFPYSKIIRPEAEGYMSTELVDSLITDSLPNKIIFESENLALISNVTSLLNSISSEEREIHLITTKREKVYDNFNISRKHLGNINFTYADGSATFENENTINFERKYLDTFNKLPTFESLRAYDLTLDIILRLAYSKKIFFKKNNLTKYLKNSFDYKKIDKSGYSNEAFYLLMHDGYSVKEINKSEFLSK